MSIESLMRVAVAPELVEIERVISFDGTRYREEIDGRLMVAPRTKIRTRLTITLNEDDAMKLAEANFDGAGKIELTLQWRRR